MVTDKTEETFIMSRQLRRALMLGTGLLLIGGAWAAEPTAPIPTKADSSAAPRTADEEWLRTVWSQIDTLVQQADFPAQATVTAGGVRGAEAEDVLAGKYYYFKGGHYYPNEQLINEVVAALEQKLQQRPKKADAARLKYLAALCYDILGQRDQAMERYRQVTRKHGKSPFATQARARLTQLEAGATAKP